VVGNFHWQVTLELGLREDAWVEFQQILQVGDVLVDG